MEHDVLDDQPLAREQVAKSDLARYGLSTRSMSSRSRSALSASSRRAPNARARTQHVQPYRYVNPTVVIGIVRAQAYSRSRVPADSHPPRTMR